jgi:ubiquitin-protein ligase E3 C
MVTNSDASQNKGSCPKQNIMIADCYTATIKNLQFILSDLYSRWARRSFCCVETWLISGGSPVALVADGSTRSIFSFAVLQWMPWSVDFSKRLKFVRDELDRERIAVQGGHDPYGLTGGFRSQGTVVRIRRSQVLNDGMRSLMSLSAEQWRDRIVVRYINQLGADEAGIDVGGLFKDFVTDLSATIFDPSYGLFSQTQDGLLYPNPSAGAIYQNTELEDMFLFIGRVLGKAIFENITISPQFTHFFLAFMHGRYNFMNLIDDLATLDADLFKNLMFLKNCEVRV